MIDANYIETKNALMGGTHRSENHPESGAEATQNPFGTCTATYATLPSLLVPACAMAEGQKSTILGKRKLSDSPEPRRSVTITSEDEGRTSKAGPSTKKAASKGTNGSSAGAATAAGGNGWTKVEKRKRDKKASKKGKQKEIADVTSSFSFDGTELRNRVTPVSLDVSSLLGTR